MLKKLALFLIGSEFHQVAAVFAAFVREFSCLQTFLEDLIEILRGKSIAYGDHR